MMIVTLGPRGPQIIDLPPHSNCNNSFGPAPLGWGPDDSKYVTIKDGMVFFDIEARNKPNTVLGRIKKGYFG